MLKVGRNPKPGQLGFGGSVVLETIRPRKDRRLKRNLRGPGVTAFVIFNSDGRVALGSQPVYHYTAVQAITGYRRTRKLALGPRPQAVPLSELRPDFKAGMTLAEARGWTTATSPEPKRIRRRADNAEAYVVFGKNHRVVKGRQPILASSALQAVTGYRHTRHIDPGEDGYAIRLSELIGTRLLDPNRFCRQIKPNMTEDKLRGVPELGRPRSLR